MELTKANFADLDVTDFNRKFKETLMELESRRKLLKEKYEELLNLTSEKSFLQQELDKERQEKSYIQKQLDEIKTISRQREDKWSNFRDNWAQNKIKFEINNKTTEAFKSQISKQQQEISQLKADKEELEREIRDNLGWKEKCIATHSRVESTIETLVRQIRNLKEDQIKLDSTTKAALTLANKAEKSRSNYEKSLNSFTEENLKLKKNVTELTIQLEEMKFRLNTKLPDYNKAGNCVAPTEELLDERKEYRAERYKDVESNFEKAKHMYDCIAQLQNLEKDALNRVKELEEKLQIMVEESKKPEVKDFETQVTLVPEETLINEDAEDKSFIKDQITSDNEHFET